MDWLPNPYVNGRVGILIIGGTGSGKTWLAVNDILMDRYYRVFDNVFLICPTYESRRNTIWHEKIHLKPNKVFLNYSEATLDLIIDYVYEHPDESTVIVFDDCISQKDFASNSKLSAMNELQRSGRHQDISTMVLSQRYNDVSTEQE